MTPPPGGKPASDPLTDLQRRLHWGYVRHLPALHHALTRPPDPHPTHIELDIYPSQPREVT